MLQMPHSDEGPIDLLDDDEEEYEEGMEPYVFDEHGNPIEGQYVQVQGGEEYQEGGESPQANSVDFP